MAANPDPDIPSLADWRRLYQAAQTFRDLRPWQWMSEHHMFGITTSDASETGFCSVMGILGEHFALAVYRGASGLTGLCAVKKMRPGTCDALLVTDMLMASFEDRQFTEKPDRDIIRQLGLSFRGSKNWPIFRGYLPRYAPWFLNPSETRFLTDALTQTTYIARKSRDDPAYLLAPNPKHLLVRTKDQHNQWHNSWQPTPPRQSATGDQSIQRQPPDQKLMAKLKQTAICPLHIEIDIFPGFEPIVDKPKTRPFIPYLILAVESQSGFIIGQHLGRYEELYNNLPNIVGQILLDSSIQLPHEIHTRSKEIHHALLPLNDLLQITIKETNRLPAIAEARRAFNQFMPR